ncbi:MAG: hypothetical protein K9N06_10850 [Candidatus Cloacimonetes bacterium]|nr:hypothetical protein [Candidatus Cloacimonadota bacterium]
MNRTAFILIAVLTVLPLILSAIEFDLNSYQVADYREDCLSIGLNNSGSSGNGSSEEYYQSGNYLEADFSEMRYSRQQSLLLKGNIGLTHSLKILTVDDSTDLEKKYFSLAPNLGISGQYRRYILKNWFFEINISEDYSRDYDYKESFDVSKNREDEYNLDKNEFICEPGLGLGRRENATRARQALYMLEELEKTGMLIREVNTTDVTYLADLLVSVEHLRLFDSRLKTQEALREVVNHLIMTGLIENAGIENFLIVKDMYFYGDRYPRFSGWDFKAMMRYSNLKDEYNSNSRYYHFNPDYDDDIRDYTSVSNTDRYGPALKFNYSRNFGKNWQLDIITDLDYMFNTFRYDHHSNQNQESLSRRDEDTKELDLQTEVNLNWYVSTRTHLWAEISYDYEKINGDGIDESFSDSTYTEYDYDGEAQYFDFSLNAEYYISPRLFLDFSLTLHNIKIRDDYEGWEQRDYDYDSFSTRYSLKLNYDIF